jgi:4-hydroxybenzoate polyprenyltransferase
MARDAAPSLWHVVLFFIGAFAMRGAGCTWNDLVDRNLDGLVERTRSRPIPSGQVTVAQATAFMVAQALIGLAVLLQFNRFTVMCGIASLLVVAVYPFMKRITYWPQVTLGLAFSWGALMGWPATFGAQGPQALVLYAGAIAWVIGYDTIYALQDMEDDALIGVRSSARRLGRHVRAGVGGFYALALILWSAAIWVVRPDPLAFVALIPAAIHLAWQVIALRPDDGGDALMKFRSNRFAGLLVFLACATVGTGAG